MVQNWLLVRVTMPVKMKIDSFFKTFPCRVSLQSDTLMIGIVREAGGRGIKIFKCIGTELIHKSLTNYGCNYQTLLHYCNYDDINLSQVPACTIPGEKNREDFTLQWDAAPQPGPAILITWVIKSHCVIRSYTPTYFLT